LGIRKETRDPIPVRLEPTIIKVGWGGGSLLFLLTWRQTAAVVVVVIVIVVDKGEIL
jgi:hypothetical protein